jgi:hypothetical protein
MAGCFAPSKGNPWALSRDEAKEISAFAKVAPLSTNDYVRVPDSQMDMAVAMLQDAPFVPLDAAQVSTFAPTLTLDAHRDFQFYLVRGLTYSKHPMATLVKFDSGSGNLLIKQAAYNGEMLWPYPPTEERNALAVLLPQAPVRVYPWAVMAGDGVWQAGPDHR